MVKDDELSIKKGDVIIYYNVANETSLGDGYSFYVITDVSVTMAEVKLRLLWRKPAGWYVPLDPDDYYSISQLQERFSLSLYGPNEKYVPIFTTESKYSPKFDEVVRHRMFLLRG